MNKFLAMSVCLLLSGCFNKAEIPSEHKVSGGITIRHEVTVSIEMKQLFRDECEAEARQLQIPANQVEQFVTDCAAEKEAAFIQALLDFLKQESGQ